MPRSVKFILRRAALSDIPQIASVLVDTWRTTFSELLSSEFLTGLSEAEQRDRYRQLLSRSDCVCLVATTVTDQVIGFVSGGPSRAPELGIPAEVYALYVRQEAQGSGLGRGLFEAAAKDLFGRVDCRLMVWVLEGNPARGFYEHLGGIELARGRVLLGQDDLGQVALAWPPQARGG